jgi:hypothetical protein
MRDAFGVERVEKAFTGYGDRALKGVKGTKQGLKMVASQKGYRPKPNLIGEVVGVNGKSSGIKVLRNGPRDLRLRAARGKVKREAKAQQARQVSIARDKANAAKNADEGYW